MPLLRAAQEGEGGGLPVSCSFGAGCSQVGGQCKAPDTGSVSGLEAGGTALPTPSWPLPAPPQPSVSHVVLGGGTFPGTPLTPSSRAPGAGASAQVLGGEGGWEGQQSRDWPSAQR